MSRLIPVLLAAALLPAADWRHIVNGWEIPNEGYADQPYIVKTDDGAWLCVITTGTGREGEGGQHVVSMRSTDRGRTWSKPVDVEPANGPEASYAVMLKAPSGRVFVFYNHNTDNIRQVIGDNPPYKDGIVKRVDSLGHFVFKYSDDHGRTWSAKRYEIPQRDFEIDRRNVYQGKIKFFWTVGKAFAYKGAGYVPLHKVGGFGDGFFTSSEGVLLRSANIFNEKDASKIRWETLPDGEKGIRAPEGGGTIAEEQSFSVLSDGTIFCVFRTIDGHPAYTYSRDGGRTWEPSQYMRFGDGRLMKHPRAATFAWRCENGKFLYWFHNHGGRFIREHPRQRSNAYEDRNPVWLVGGVEVDSPQGRVIRWSQPEIALYDDDPIIRMSYPDLVEDGGKYFLTETQKDVGRVHEIDATLLEGLWNGAAKAPADSVVLDSVGGRSVAAPAFPVWVRRSQRMDHATEYTREGFALELRTKIVPGAVLLDNRTADGRGMRVAVTVDRTVEMQMSDGRTRSSWESDPVMGDGSHHVVINVDGGPKIITFVVDGLLHDGGERRQFGWGRYDPNLKTVAADAQLRVGDAVSRVRVYKRVLRTAEAIGAYREHDFNPARAAAHLGRRGAWWMSWARSARDQNTHCVSCHTSMPVALAGPADARERVLADVRKRVRGWAGMEPAYKENSGADKPAQSRSTEAVLNALLLRVLEPQGADARTALGHMLALQEADGSWNWLDFAYQPWEAKDSRMWGTLMAAVAIGDAPEGRGALERIGKYLTPSQPKTGFHKLTLLWAAARAPQLLTPAERRTLLHDVEKMREPDGGFRAASLLEREWKRRDASPAPVESDGYATAYAAFCLQQAGIRDERALAWLAARQDPETGRVPAASMNKSRDPESEVGQFMSDAATAYAVLALRGGPVGIGTAP